MAVTLPPVIPPQQAEVAQLQRQGAESAAFDFQSWRVHVLGPAVLDRDTLASATQEAATLSDVVRNLAARYYEAGYPAAQLRYGLAGSDLYVVATLGKLARIEGPQALKSYFEDLAGLDPLTDSAFEQRRVLATAHADRAGLQVEPVFRPDPSGDAYTMTLEPVPEAPDPTRFKIELGNPGNRFVGRHFLDLDLRHGLASGDEFNATWRTGLKGLNDDEAADRYDEEMLSWSRVTRYGIFGLSGRNVDYRIDLRAESDRPLYRLLRNLLPFLPPNTGEQPIKGDIQQIEAAWAYPLAADFHSRWSVNAKLDYTLKELELRDSDARIQHQEYGSIEAGTAYGRTIDIGERRLDLDGGLALRKGLGSDETDEATSLADLGYLLWRPQLSARLSQGDFSTRLELYAQLTGDSVPEQSQWVLGGLGNLASYLPGVAVGDSGGLARLQVDYRLFGKGERHALVPRAFVEYGYARFENPQAGLPGGTPAIADAGVELAFSYSGWLDASLAYAESFHERDIDKQTLDDADANIYFRAALKF